MNKEMFASIPGPDLAGGAGTGSPQNRETRYKAYQPRLRQQRAEEEKA